MSRKTTAMLVAAVTCLLTAGAARARLNQANPYRPVGRGMTPIGKITNKAGRTRGYLYQAKTGTPYAVFNNGAMVRIGQTRALEVGSHGATLSGKRLLAANPPVSGQGLLYYSPGAKQGKDLLKVSLFKGVTTSPIPGVSHEPIKTPSGKVVPQWPRGGYFLAVQPLKAAWRFNTTGESVYLKPGVIDRKK